MLTEMQRARLTAENKALHNFVSKQSRIDIVQNHGTPPNYYRLRFNNLKTSVVRELDHLKMIDPPVEVIPVSFEMAINVGDVYPRVKPEIILSPVQTNGISVLLYNSHVLLFEICIFSRWMVRHSLIDVVTRTWNVLSYNHDLLNLDRTDCLNPAALEWYKSQFCKESELFPTDDALEYVADVSQSKSLQSGELFKFSDHE